MIQEQLINRALNNNIKIKELGTEKNKIRTCFDDRRRELTILYIDRIRKLERERDEKISELGKTFDKRVKVKNKEIHRLSEVVNKLKRIKKYSSLKRKNLDIKKGSVKQGGKWRSDYYLEWLGYIYKDKYLKIRLLIAQNDKPKNKYSLIAYGKCFFTASLIKFNYHYFNIGLSDWNQGFIIKCNIRDFPSIEAAKVYTKRHNDFLKSDIEKFEEVKKEYLNIIKQNYDLKAIRKAVKRLE